MRWLHLSDFHFQALERWHLCWLLHAPEDAVHRRGLDEALDEGLGDAARPGVAEELRKLIPKSDG